MASKKMKVTKKMASIVSVIVLLVLIILSVVLNVLLQSNTPTTVPIITTRIRASGTTYKRIFVIKKLSPTVTIMHGSSPSITPSPTAFNASDGVELDGPFKKNGNLASDESALVTISPKEGFNLLLSTTVQPTATWHISLSPTSVYPTENVSSSVTATISSLPQTGTYHYSIAFFAVASIALFLAFLF